MVVLRHSLTVCFLHLAPLICQQAAAFTLRAQVQGSSAHGGSEGLGHFGLKSEVTHAEETAAADAFHDDEDEHDDVHGRNGTVAHETEVAAADLGHHENATSGNLTLEGEEPEDEIGGGNATTGNMTIMSAVADQDAQDSDDEDDDSNASIGNMTDNDEVDDDDDGNMTGNDDDDDDEEGGNASWWNTTVDDQSDDDYDDSSGDDALKEQLSNVEAGAINNHTNGSDRDIHGATNSTTARKLALFGFTGKVFNADKSMEKALAAQSDATFDEDEGSVAKRRKEKRVKFVSKRRTDLRRHQARGGAKSSTTRGNKASAAKATPHRKRTLHGKDVEGSAAKPSKEKKLSLASKHHRDNIGRHQKRSGAKSSTARVASHREGRRGDKGSAAKAASHRKRTLHETDFDNAERDSVGAKSGAGDERKMHRHGHAKTLARKAEDDDDANEAGDHTAHTKGLAGRTTRRGSHAVSATASHARHDMEDEHSAEDDASRERDDDDNGEDDKNNEDNDGPESAEAAQDKADHRTQLHKGDAAHHPGRRAHPEHQESNPGRHKVTLLSHGKRIGKTEQNEGADNGEDEDQSSDERPETDEEMADDAERALAKSQGANLLANSEYAASEPDDDEDDD